MAPQNRRSDPSIENVLFEEPYRFDIFQAVRLLELINPERAPIGRQNNPLDEVVRFRSHLTLAFPPSAIHEIEPPRDGVGPARIMAAFMGLTGPLGVLPRHYTELLLERTRRKDFAARDFFDIFNHRLLSLFHRAWEKYRFPVDYEQAAAHNREDRFSQHIFDLIGMGTGGLRGRVAFDEEALLFYAGLLGQHPRSATTIAAILSDYFDVPIAIKQFVGEWLDITQENRTRLGPGDSNNRLGLSAVAGVRVWDQQAKFTLRVGPLTFANFPRFLPNGDAFRPLIEFARYCSGQEFDFDVQLVLRASEVPWCQLGTVQLGFTSWLKTREFVLDADQVVFSGGLTRLGALP
ncbi:MAG: type VI secretion system baseplate subunit TssG [Deltaproteobacteria bacterium]|nr:type VI secretion system baseplate subunit TssG [Deltaproteobacteria bacterium]